MAWLMGPFITAYLKVNQRSETARQQAESWLAGFAEHLTTTGLGQSVRSPMPNTLTPRVAASHRPGVWRRSCAPP